jgi:hypothetical protein
MLQLSATAAPALKAKNMANRIWGEAMMQQQMFCTVEQLVTFLLY